MTDEGRATGPGAMRDLVRDYVAALHATYLDHTRHLPPAERAALPLLAAGGVTVVAAAAQRLHLVATTDPLPRPQGPEVALSDSYLGTEWTVRFYDSSLLPELGILTEDSPSAVRRALGVTATVYHLTVAVGGGLGSHHAQHSGVALANQHARTIRDLDRVRTALPHQPRLVDEFRDCVRLGLSRASALLAAELTSGRVQPVAGASTDDVLEAVVRDVSR
jgi:hypothetical protein